MKKWLVGFACVGMLATAAWGAQNIAEGTDVVQNFDSIGATATAALPTDWKTDKQATARTVGTFAAAVAATERVDGQNVSSSAANGIYNLGAPTDDAADRAIGWLSSSSATKSGNLYLEMVNSGATAITNLFISYNVEKYRNGSNAAGFQIQLYYSTDGSTWTSAGAAFLTTFPADADSLGFATPPGATVAVSGNLDLTAAPIAASANVYLAWNYSVQSGTATGSAQLLGVDDVSIALAGVSIPSINFSAALASVDENAGAYGVTINKNMASGDVSGEIVLSGTATEGAGADYVVDTTNFTLNGETTSATITVTVNDDADPEPAETVVLALANVVGANLLVPNVFTLTINASDAPTHSIAIVTNAPENGMVTTTPEGTAEEGATVTIAATPADGYRVASIAVVDGLSNPVTVTGNTFVMPTSDATVTVTFEVYDAPDVLIDFEDYAGTYASNDYSTAGVTFGMTNATAGTTASDPKNGAVSGRFAHDRGGAGHPAVMLQSTAFAQPIGKMNFWYADYGTDNTTTFKVQMSSDGATWQDVGEAAYDPDGATLLEGVIDSVPANMAYFQIITLAGAGDRVNIDDIGLWFGAATFGVGFDKTSGFTIEQGAGSAITATAANGTEPYGYSWSSSLDGAHYSALDNVFTILATAPIGDYWAQVVATDATAAAVTNTINFSVVPPVVKYAIGIVTNAPENGTVATDPATEAAEGATVTVTATPALGYSVASIEVVDEAMNPVAVTGNTFTMPAAAVTVTVMFQVYEGGALIISQYYEGASFDKWIEIYNPGSATVDLAADGYRLGIWSNEGRETWKTGGTPTAFLALAGTIPAGGTYLVSHSSAALPAYATANETSSTVGNFNGDDSLVLYTGETYAFANVVDAFGLTGDTAGNKSYVRKTTVTAGVNTDFNADEWDEFTNAAVDGAAEGTNERLGYHSTGPAVFGVSFDKTEGFTLEQGVGGTITATAANGTEPYAYDWSTDMAFGDYTNVDNVFTIGTIAPVGDYFATVVATDSSDPAQNVTNTIHFSIQVPAPAYPISISTNPAAGGTVTTAPAGEATNGQTVVVTATPAVGYAVGAITATESGGGTELPVVGNAFVMTNSGVMVSVTFVVDIATLPISEVHETTTDWTALAGWSGVSMGSYSDGDAQFGASADSLTVNFDAQPGTLGFDLQGRTTTTGTAPAQFLVEESADGSSWTQVASIDDTQLSTATASFGPYTLLEASRYVRWTYVNKYGFNIGLNNVAITSGGAPVFSVSVDKTNGFTVAEGATDTITATPANGTEPIAYGWSSTLDPADYTAVGNAFTIEATAPAGDYSATVYATNSDLATAQATVSFSVVGGGDEHPPIPAITFVAGTGFSFPLPDGHTVSRMEAAGTATDANGEFIWSAFTDYTVEESTVTINSAGADARMIRVWFN